ncbi:MAG: hypothetical protein AAF571_12145 [Verrucomicrobiota bacterium]
MKEEEPFPWFELIVLLPILGALALGGWNWWQGSSFWVEAGGVLLVFFGSGLALLVKQGIATGKLEMRGGSVDRGAQPFWFWGFAVFYMVVGLCFFLGGLILLLFPEMDA